MAFPVELHLSTPLLSLLFPSPLPSFPLPSFSLPLPKPLLFPRLTSTLLSPRRAVLRRRFTLLVASDSVERINLELHPEQGLNGAVVGEVVDVDDGRRRRSKWRGLKDRVVFGIGIGVGAGAVVVTGGWVFAVALAAASFVGSREYFEMVRSQEMAIGMTPPPRYVSRFCSVICALMPLFTLYFGQIDVSVTSSSFIVAMALILQRENPRFAQLSSAIFGLFYCGYLPCFWIKLRCGLTVPALNTRLSTFWPELLGGPTHWTVGLIATLISISSIIAADTFAFLGGKFFGRTPLTAISPKKTLEGALAGLVGCVCVSVILSSMSCWPMSVLSAVAFGFLNFVGSLSGDLIESIIKRDAGVKDSGSLIPGHGGILDRVDSYVFTGALSYSFIKTMLPLFGV